MENLARIDRWTIETAMPATPTKVPLGPFRTDWLPGRFVATVVDEQEGWRVELEGRFDGARIAVPTINLSRPGGIKAGDLTALALPEIVRVSAESLGTVQEANHVGQRLNRRPQGEELDYVAAVYSWAYATWGNPRLAVAAVWGLKPATASYWINKAREIHTFPGRDEQEV